MRSNTITVTAVLLADKEVAGGGVNAVDAMF
jgi:hypothetical protein